MDDDPNSNLSYSQLQPQYYQQFNYEQYMNEAEYYSNSRRQQPSSSSSSTSTSILNMSGQRHEHISDMNIHSYQYHHITIPVHLDPPLLKQQSTSQSSIPMSNNHQQSTYRPTSSSSYPITSTSTYSNSHSHSHPHSHPHSNSQSRYQTRYDYNYDYNYQLNNHTVRSNLEQYHNSSHSIPNTHANTTIPSSSNHTLNTTSISLETIPSNHPRSASLRSVSISSSVSRPGSATSPRSSTTPNSISSPELSTAWGRHDYHPSSQPTAQGQLHHQQQPQGSHLFTPRGGESTGGGENVEEHIGIKKTTSGGGRKGKMRKEDTEPTTIKGKGKRSADEMMRGENTNENVGGGGGRLGRNEGRGLGGGGGMKANNANIQLGEGDIKKKMRASDQIGDGEENDSLDGEGDEEEESASVGVERGEMSQQPIQKKKKKSKMHGCEVCGKLFPRPSGLKTHMNTHNNAKPYACGYPGCSRTFGVRSNAKRHLRTHGVNPAETVAVPRGEEGYVIQYGGEPSKVDPSGSSFSQVKARTGSFTEDGMRFGDVNHDLDGSTPNQIHIPNLGGGGMSLDGAAAAAFKIRWMPPSLTIMRNAAELKEVVDQEDEQGDV